MCTCHERRPIFCILPPHILDSVAKNGTPGQRQDALKTMAVDQTIRVVRASIAMGLTGPTARRRGAPAAAPSAQRTSATGRTARGAGPGRPPHRGSGPRRPGCRRSLWRARRYLRPLLERARRNRSTMPACRSPPPSTIRATTTPSGTASNGVRRRRQLFNRFTISIDVIGHELTHGVTEAETGLPISAVRR